MIIKKIKLENIRSYESSEIEFPLGSTLLSGDIGSGKTSVLLAIEFALFGLQPGQKGTSLLRNGKNEGSITLELEVDGKNVIIERKLKKVKSVSQDYTAITIDNEKRELSITELKNIILELLNYPSEFAKKTNILYKFTVYTPQEEMKQIILEDAETRLDALRHVFGIDKYKRIKENTSLFTIKLRETIRKKEGMLQDLDYRKDKLNEKQKLLIEISESREKAEIELQKSRETRKKIEEEMLAIEEKIEEKKKYEQEIDKTKILWAGKKEFTLNIQKEEEQIKKNIEEIKKISFSEEELKKTENEKIKLKEDENIKNKEYFDALSQLKAFELKNSEISKLKEQILKIKLCPTCLQNVDNEYKNNIMDKFDNEYSSNIKRIQELNERKIKLVDEIDILQKNSSLIDKKISEIQLLKIKLESIKDKEQRLNDIGKQKETIEKDLALLDKHIELLRSSVREFSKFGLIYSKKEAEFKEALKIEREADIKLASIIKEIEMTKQEIINLQKEIEEKEKIKKELIKMSELESWLSNDFLAVITFTERNILLKLREEFSKLFNEWFNVLVPDIFTAHLDEDFTPVIEQQDYELDYSFLSGGERTAVALAYRLALNQTLNSLLSRIKTRDIVILDEPTDGFSEQQLDKMRDVLLQLKVKQLILVSHEQKIESFVENIIKFKKENGVTIVEK